MAGKPGECRSKKHRRMVGLPISGALIAQVLFLLIRTPFASGQAASIGQVEPADSCGILIEHIANLGSPDDPASVVIPLHVDIAGVPWGGWLVTEEGKEILEYSEDGTFRRFLGRRGEGPGELKAPNAVEVDPSDSVWISNRRGRSVVYDPEGNVGRTIVGPDFHQITSFTPSGLPMTMLLKVNTEGPPPPEVFPFIQVWSREGRPLLKVGPGAMVSEAAGVMVTGVGNPPQCAVTNDTTLYFPLGGESPFVKWTPTTTDTVAVPDSMRLSPGMEVDRKPETGDRLVALVPDRSGGFWALGVLRRLSKEDEEELVRNAPQPGIQTMEAYKRQSAAVANAVYDGWLGHLTAEGVVTEAVVFEEHPWGFSRLGEFFTFDEDETGLVRVRVWSFTRSCPQAGAG